MSETPATKERATEVLGQLLKHMGLEAEVVAHEDEERIMLEVKGPETGLVIGKKGQTLDSLQYLVNKIVSKGSPKNEEGESESKPINVDAEGYRERRAEALTELAHKLADKARKSGKPVAAEPMSAADRRVIHVALAEAQGVTTRSEGEGIYRHLVVIPTGGESTAPK
jgi:spoIIIJ-associated protein